MHILITPPSYASYLISHLILWLLFCYASTLPVVSPSYYMRGPTTFLPPKLSQSAIHTRWLLNSWHLFATPKRYAYNPSLLRLFGSFRFQFEVLSTNPRFLPLKRAPQVRISCMLLSSVTEGAYCLFLDFSHDFFLMLLTSIEKISQIVLRICSEMPGSGGEGEEINE